MVVAKIHVFGLNQPPPPRPPNETGVNTEHNPPKFVGIREMRTSYTVSPRSSLTTVIACGSAIGNGVSPYVVYKGVRLAQDLVTGGFPGTHCNVSLHPVAGPPRPFSWII